MKKLLVLLLAIFTCFLFVACGDKYELNVEEAHKNVTLEVGQTFKVNATYTEGAPVSWESKNPDVVTVSNGLLTAIAVGNAKVVISIKESELSVEINVEVKDITPTAVEVTGAASVVIGQTASYSANVLPSNAKQEVVWLVDNKELADISETGVLTAKAEGTVKVTATSKVGNVVGSLDVAISKPAPTTVTISGENNVKVGATLQLSAIVAPDLASQDVEWLVDNEELATIDANGLLTPKAEGKVVVTAKAVGTDVKGTLEVTISVVEKTLAEVIAAEAGTYKVQGTVVALNAQSFVLKEGDASILVYNGSSWTADVKVGDKVTLVGTTSVYANAVQFGKGSKYEVTGSEEVANPEAKELTVAEFDAYASAEVITLSYGKIVGTLSISDNKYYNVAVDGATCIGSITYPADKEALAALDGKKIVVEGYITGFTGGKYVNFVATKVEEDVKEYTVAFSDDVASQKVKEGEKATKPADPIKEGFVFKGWFVGETEYDFNSAVTSDVTLTAKWEKEVLPSIKIGTTKYDTLDAAIAAAVNGSVIRLTDGEYKLETVINKSVTIKGTGHEKVTIVITKDIAANVDAPNVVFEGVTLKGSNSSGSAGTYMQATANVSTVTFNKCHITSMNSFFKHQSGTNSVKLTIENSKISDIGQFLVWNTKPGDIYFINNEVDAASCGAVVNEAACLIRARGAGKVYIYGNVITGTTMSIDGIVEGGADCELVEVKYNVFKGVTKFVHINTSASKPVVFDENLYLDADGNVLTEVPAQVTGNGVTKDVTICASEEERAKKFLLASVDYDILFVDANDSTAYATIALALAAAKDGDHIVLADGEYVFESVINKSVTIEGSSYEKVIITVTANVAANVDAADITFKGVTLRGSNSSGGAGTYMQATANAANVTFEGCHITRMNSFFKHQSGTNSVKLTIENSKISDIGQFLVWNTKPGDIYFINNEVDAASCGAVVNEAACLIRARGAGKVYIYGNVITGTTISIDGIVEGGADCELVEVKYNVFKGVTKFVHINTSASKPVVFDENLYLDADGNVLTEVPAQVTGNGVTKDVTICASEEERNDKANIWLDGIKSSVAYKIEYELNGGTLTGAPEEYKANDLPLVLPEPTLDGKVFLGWFDNAEFKGEKVTNIIFGTTGDVKLYARFGEEWQLKAIYVGEGRDYESVAEAVAAAKEGQYIVIYPGTYDEDVVVEMNNLVIYGANKGIAYDGERGEETVVKSIKLTGNNLVVDGIKFSAIQGVEIAGGSDIAIKNSLLGGTPTANSQQMLLASGKVNNLVVEGCKFEGLNTGLAFSHYRAILTNELVTNALIKDNKFIQYAAASVYIDSVKLLKSAGHIEIVENFFDWPGDNFTIFLGSSSIAANTLIDINYNEFSGTEPMSGFTNRYCPATATVNFIGNKLHNVKGTVFEVRGTGASDRATAFTVNVLNNIIADTSSKLSFSGAVDNVKVDGNYIFQDVVWSNNTATVTNPAASAEGVLEGIKTHKVEFVLDGGSTVANLPAEFVEGAKYPLNYATPTKEGYYFKGWYNNAEFTGEAVTSYGAETADVKLYAKWELIPVYTITYDLDGGTCEGLVESTYEKVDVKLPTPSKFGYVFLGWSLEKGSTEYVTKLNLEANATVYANWLQAEVYTVEYVLNGGSIKYTSREELVNDFVKDYSLLMGKTYQTGADIPTGAWDDIDYHAFFGKSFDDGTTVKSKWLWLGEYLYELSSRDLAYNNCNVLGLKDLLNNGAFAGDNSYGLSYAFRAFLAGSTVRPGTGYTSVDYTVYENANGFWAKLSASENSKLETYGTTVLPTPAYGLYKFGGWYDNPEFTGTPITEVTGAAKVYAKWEEAKPVQTVTITNVISEIKRFETYQLTWVLNPTDADIQNVKFYSSDPVVATVDDKGFITTYTNGKVKIKVVSDSSTGASAEFELDVYSPDHFEISYETESYVAVENNIQLNASYIKRGNVVVNEISWSSLNPEIATVDATGMVAGVKAGVATIRAALTSDANIYVDFTVTVLTGEESEMLKFIIAQNESNVFTRYDLSIGGVYTSDIFSSISKIFYNHEMKINSDYLEAGNATNDYYANSTVEQGLEFITVHYTAGFDATADTDNHASYFTKGTADVSIHYVTGNKGSNGGTPTDEIYATLDHKNGAWHAGDSNARYYSNSDKKVGEDLVFSWMKTGVAYDNVDLMDVVWTVSDDFYYVINGKKTDIKLPETYNFKSRNTNHIYNADGTISSQSNFTGGAFTNRTPESFFNSQGFPVTVIDGEYYMGPTWWSYGQVTEGRICGVGGNLSSIGIESCVNQGSDLWYTWQVTAQLVASLMIQYDLSIERVKGHHFFDGKNCPQPMLEHDLEIWYEFLELVEAEYELLKTYKDYEVKMTLGGTYDFVSEYGRITEQPEFASVIKYTVEIKKGSTTETITLASSVNGIYSK